MSAGQPAGNPRSSTMASRSLRNTSWKHNPLKGQPSFPSTIQDSRRATMNRTLLLGGRAIIIEALGQPLDQSFDRFFAAYFGNTPLPWEAFAATAMRYFDTTLGNWEAHNAYFNNFTIVWRTLLGSGRFIE